METIRDLETELLKEYKDSAIIFMLDGTLTIKMNMVTDTTSEIERKLYEIIDDGFEYLMEETISDLQGEAFHDVEQKFNTPLKEIDWENTDSSWITKKYIMVDKTMEAKKEKLNKLKEKFWKEVEGLKKRFNIQNNFMQQFTEENIKSNKKYIKSVGVIELDLNAVAWETEELANEIRCVTDDWEEYEVLFKDIQKGEKNEK